MRNILAATVLAFSTMGFTADASPCSVWSKATYGTFHDNGKGERSRGYICREIEAKPGLRTVVTLRNMGRKGDWNVGVSRRFDHDDLTFVGRLAYHNNSGPAAEMFILPASASGRYTLVAWPVSDKPSKACLVVHYVDEAEIFGEALFLATAQFLLQSLLTGDNPSDDAKRNAGRIAAVGMSALRGRDLEMIGYDALMNEVSGTLAATFGGGSFLFSLGVSYFAGFLEAAGQYSFSQKPVCNA